MRSMTGFGVGSAALGDGRLSVEIRALNHRYQDVRVRVPAELSEQGFYVEQLARTQLGRGRYDLAVRWEGERQQAPHVDEARIEGLYRALAPLAERLTPGAPLPLSAVLALPHVVETRGLDSDATRRALQEAFDAAQRGLSEMRRQEGDALAAELSGRLQLARQLAAEIESGAAELVEHQRTRLRERVRKLLDGVEASIDPSRLEAELALLADKSDITEELVRLQSHFDQMATLFGSSESVGRRLDFLLQEVGREVNTIGSKAQHASVSHRVVAMKAEMERMREQVQNVE